MVNRGVANRGLILVLGSMIAFWNSLSNAEPAPIWEEVYNSDGIKVETADREGHSIEYFRATTILPGSIDSVMAVLADPEACSLWVHGCLSAEILDSAGFSQRNTYQVNDFPWPTQDRDLVVEVKIEQNLENNTVLYQLINRPNYRAPSDYVRMTAFQGSYLLTVIEDEKTKIEWVQYADPGGSLPGWLVNSLIIDVPVNTLQSLAQLVQREPYASAVTSTDSKGLRNGWVQQFSVR